MKKPEIGPASSRRGSIAIGFLGLSILLVGGAALALTGSPPSTGHSFPALDPKSAAKIAYVDRDWKRAESILRDLVKSAPRDLGARVLLGRILLDRGNLLESRELFSGVLKADPGNAEAIRGLGGVYRKFGQLDLAITCWMQAAELVRTDPQLWKELGLAQREKGDWAGALSSFQESLNLDRNQGDVSNLLAELTMRKPDSASALPPLPGSRIAPLDPANPRALDIESRFPRPRPPDPSQNFPRPGGPNR